jgi:exodeoxyribonuclease V beta subunit
MQLIEASAGTGKTWNICGLYLRLLLERRLSVQQILVVTFTKAATAELRERIRARLAEALLALRAPGTPVAGGDRFVPDLLQRLRDQPDGDDAERMGRLDAALQTFDEASIFTIHGFCQRALADTPFAAQMPLVQTLLADDGDLLLQAVHDVWRQRVAGAGADPALVAYLLARGDTPERWARLLKRQMAKPLSLARWPDDIDRTGETPAQAGELSPAFEAARSIWAGQREAVLQALRAGLPRLHGATYKAEALQTAAQGWDSLLASPLPPAPGTPLPDKLALLASGTLQQRAKKDQQPPGHAFCDAAQALLDALARAERQLQLARLRLLRELLADGAQRLRQTKRAQRVVAFDDMLFNLHERLSGGAAPGLAAALRARFPAALIDEFQDTDPLQFAVFRAIYRDDAAGAADAAPPLFLVGDPKQAIYSFRHADLHTYLQARDQADGCHTLLANQRATAALIDALNGLFGRNPQAFVQPGLQYHPVALGAKPRPPLHDDSEPRAPLQVWTLPRDARSGTPLLKPRAVAAVAETCAGEITRLLQAAADGQMRLGERALQAGDIAVLVRSHAQGSVMRQALAALGVGSVELSQASVFQSPDAEELERVLAAMLEPGRPGALQAALATRCLGFDAARIEALADDDATLGAQLQALAGHHQIWRQRGVGLMLRQWLHGEQVAARLLAQADGPRRLTNLLHLIECLHQAEREHAAPEALLRWLQAQRADDRGDETSQLRLESDRNLVQIVTIHKSKGLEYPVVFCPFLWDGRLGSGGDGLDGLTRHDDAGQAVIDYRAGLDEAFDEAGAKAEARLEAAAEFMRLVYVALTRAVQRCYLVAGAYRNRTASGSSGNEAGRALLNWLVAGDGLSPSDWLSIQRQVADADALDAAWAALAQSLPAAALAVDVLPLPRREPLRLAPTDAAVLQALPPPARLGDTWSIGSYSALVRGAQSESPVAAAGALPPAAERSDRAAADHDLLADTPPDTLGDGELPAAVTPQRAAEMLADDDILGFPRGAAAGECVHAVLEWADFGAPERWPAAIERALRQHPPAPVDSGDTTAAPALAARRWAAMLQRMLGDVLGLPLPLGTARPLRLAELPPGRRLAELAFHLHAPRLDARRLNGTLAALGYAESRLDFAPLQGYLKGFIDLVFEHDGRYFIADWKSNHLGHRATDYGPDALAAAMAAHHYHLQYLLYGVALHRWLRARRPGYRFEQHFGGALYLFVRGVRPGWRNADGTPTGVFFHRPTAAAIERLSALLDGAEVPA